MLKQWEHQRRREAKEAADFGEATHAANPRPVVAVVTAGQRREKRLAGLLGSLSELVFVYRHHTDEYYRKNGQVTREVGAIEDALRILGRR